MAFEQIRLDRPLSRLELVMLVILISLCAVWLLHRLAYLEAVAEARSLDMTVRSLRTGIMVTVATRLLQGDNEGIASMAGANPVGAVIDAPAGYIGAVRQVNPGSMKPGQWYFDDDAKTLVYHVVNSDYVAQTGMGPVRARFSLKLNYDDTNGNGTYDPGIDSPVGASLEILDPLDWRF
ncbi:MAG: hypothetical protein HYY48_11680 [Gammaproteobacteria bacterium]|nr:hypothetical protein [Gammaproteobacteria bacterium]